MRLIYNTSVWRPQKSENQNIHGNILLLYSLHCAYTCHTCRVTTEANEAREYRVLWDGTTGDTSTLCYTVLSALCFISRGHIERVHDVSTYYIE